MSLYKVCASGGMWHFQVKLSSYSKYQDLSLFNLCSSLFKKAQNRIARFPTVSHCGGRLTTSNSCILPLKFKKPAKVTCSMTSLPGKTPN